MKKENQGLSRRSVIVCLAVTVVVAALITDQVIYVLNVRNQNRCESTMRGLRDLQRDLTFYSFECGQIPGPSLKDAVDALHQYGVRTKWKDYQMVLDGVDAWNQPLVYDWRSSYEVAVRSVGANGIDDHGNGDDIQRMIEVPPALRKE